MSAPDLLVFDLNFSEAATGLQCSPNCSATIRCKAGLSFRWDLSVADIAGPFAPFGCLAAAWLQLAAQRRLPVLRNARQSACAQKAPGATVQGAALPLVSGLKATDPSY